MTRATGGSAVTRAVWGAISLLALGAVVGAVAHHSIRLPAALHSDSPADRHEAALYELTRELDLDDGQVERIHQALQRHSEVLEHTYRTLHMRLEAAVDTVHQEIESLLTDDQRRRFREWARSHDRPGAGDAHPRP